MTVLILAAFVAPRFLPEPDLREGRRLAASPRWQGSLEKFRTDTDAFVADNFPARTRLIAALNYLRLRAGVSGSEKVLIGREGWLFYNDDSLLGPARGESPLTPETAEQLMQNLAGRAEFLEARGAQYLVIAAPLRETLYPEYAPSWFRLSPRRFSPEIAAAAERMVPGRVLHLHDALVRAKAGGATTFSRHDTHWTGEGAYAGYLAVMQRLRAQGLDQEPRPLSAFRARVGDRPHDLAQMLGVGGFLPIEYVGYEDPAAASWKTIWLGPGRRDFTAAQVIDTGQPSKPVLLMQRDSFSIALAPFLTGHFSKVVLTHIDQGHWRQDLIERYRPDFVILEVQENGLGAVLSSGPAASEPARARIHAALSSPASAKPASLADKAALKDARPAPGCSIDEADFTVGGLQVAGWISDLRPGWGQPRGMARLTGGAGDYLQPILIDIQRQDVAAAYRRRIRQPNGFTATLGGLPAGAYRLRVYRLADQGWIACDGPEVQIP